MILIIISRSISCGTTVSADDMFQDSPEDLLALEAVVVEPALLNQILLAIPNPRPPPLARHQLLREPPPVLEEENETNILALVPPSAFSRHEI